MRPYWRKQGPDDCLHNGTVAMVTDSTCTGYVHVIALFRCQKAKKNIKQLLWQFDELNFRWIHVLQTLQQISDWRTNAVKGGEMDPWWYWRTRERWYGLCYDALSAADLSHGFHTCLSGWSQGQILQTLLSDRFSSHHSETPRLSAAILIMGRWWN